MAPGVSEGNLWTEHESGMSVFSSSFFEKWAKTLFLEISTSFFSKIWRDGKFLNPDSQNTFGNLWCHLICRKKFKSAGLYYFLFERCRNSVIEIDLNVSLGVSFNNSPEDLRKKDWELLLGEFCEELDLATNCPFKLRDCQAKFCYLANRENAYVVSRQPV